MGQMTGMQWRILTTAALGSNGARTVLANGTGTFTAGAQREMTAVGNTATLKYTGVTLGSYTGTLPTGLYGGITTGSSDNLIDNYAAGTQ